MELIVFERLDAAHLHDELWAEDPGRPAFDEAIELATDPSQAFRLLTPGGHRLDGVRRRLAGSGIYRPFLHLAWRQPSLAKRRARHVRVRSARVPEPGAGESPPSLRPAMDGTVQLYRGRFLHLNADLLYYRATLAGTSPGAVALPDGDGDGFPTVFRLTQSRRMRLQELHYLDHPLFGVLVRVTR